MLFQPNGICPICTTPGEVWCTARDWEYRAVSDCYTYLRCPACQTLFIKEVPQQTLQEIYPGNYYSFSQNAGRSIFTLKNKWDRLFYQSILKKITAELLSVLDIGGGTGEVLDVLKNADKRIGYTEVVDIDSNSKAAAEKKGHVYTHATIESYQTDKKFDVILLLNIIEHISNPAQMIEKAGSMLADGGMIIIKTPNADSLDARLFRKSYWGGLHCPRHWIIFTDDSFKQMMQPSRLKIKALKFTQGAPFWTYSVLNLCRKKDILQRKKNLVDHIFFAPLSIFFALLDVLRSPFGKTSQMFVILSR